MPPANKVLPFQVGSAAVDMQAQRQQRLIWMGNLLHDAYEHGQLRHYWVMDVEAGAAYVTGRAGDSGAVTELRVTWDGDGWAIEKQGHEGGWEPAKTARLDLSINALVGIAQLVELDLR